MPGTGLNGSPPGARSGLRKGLGAESEEKREPASDIDIGAVDGQKVLNPDGRL